MDRKIQRMARRAALGLGLMATPLALFAGPFDGVFKQAANAECGLVGVNGGSLKIENGIFYGVEVECRMTKPVSVNDMDATLYTMQCSGGDQSWTERAMLMNSKENNGLIMVWNGYAFIYDRCTEPN